MEDVLANVLNFMYNPISDLTIISIKGAIKHKACAVKGQFKNFEELPDSAKEVVKKLYEEANVENINFKNVIEAFQTDHLNNMGSAAINNTAIYSEHINLGSAIVELNIENATLLKYIKELYGEFIENDLSTEETLNAKQLMIKEWLDGKD